MLYSVIRLVGLGQKIRTLSQPFLFGKVVCFGRLLDKQCCECRRAMYSSYRQRVRLTHTQRTTEFTYFIPPPTDHYCPFTREPPLLGATDNTGEYPRSCWHRWGNSPEVGLDIEPGSSDGPDHQIGVSPPTASGPRSNAHSSGTNRLSYRYRIKVQNTEIFYI